MSNNQPLVGETCCFLMISGEEVTGKVLGFDPSSQNFSVDTTGWANQSILTVTLTNVVNIMVPTSSPLVSDDAAPATSLLGGSVLVRYEIKSHDDWLRNWSKKVG